MPGIVRGLDDEALFAMVSKLPQESPAKQTVALAIGQHALANATPGEGEAPAPARRGRPRRAVAATEGEAAAAPKRQRTTPVWSGRGRKKGEKRSPQELAKLTEKVFLMIKATPGIRMEALKKALGVTGADLTLPVKKLLADKKITSDGNKRATEYTAR